MAENDTTTTIEKPPKGQFTEQDKLLKDLFECIATEAANIERLAYNLCGEVSDIDKTLPFTLADTITRLVQSIGWKADLGGGIVDGSGAPDVRGDALGWFISTDYSKLYNEWMAAGSLIDKSEEAQWT